MEVIVALLIAVGLAMDAFAVSIASGLTTAPKNRHKTAVAFGVSFGSFQVLMPLIGWIVGVSLSGFIAAFDHWAAFTLLAFIGVKMIYDALRDNDENKHNYELRLAALLALSVATSIDSLMVGLSFAFLQSTIVFPIAVIGIVTFTLSYIGVLFGCALGKFFGEKIKAVGGLILIGIGVKVLLDHLLLV
ncbi:MAG: manganese efflux pump MntP family protein [Candidatus Bathyarchaeota archaeon]|nr:manganese efflux pump MntP family protein [Candidatus Bathyarchaeota archaeon]